MDRLTSLLPSAGDGILPYYLLVVRTPPPPFFLTTN